MGDYDDEVLFIKNMAHHIESMPLDFMEHMTHVFLIRDPERLIASFDKVIHNPNIQDIGLQREWELYQHLVERGHDPVILDSGEVLKNPKAVLQQLCDRISIPYTDEMLHWPAGPKKEDGSWAQYWYNSVHKSTGFMSPPTHTVVLRDELIPLHQEALQYYNPLFAKALKANEI
jgi:hypothetical protein